MPVLGDSCAFRFTTSGPMPTLQNLIISRIRGSMDVVLAK